MFSSSYEEARERFLAASRARAAVVAHRVHPSECGAQGEELAIDTALLGDGSAPALLIVTSGTHGVEGFCGSGCQLALLHDDGLIADIASGDVALLIVHALNPYGFSHLRRVNEDNVDLNRNFHDFGKPLPSNPEYARLHAYLVPDRWPPAPENEAVLHAYVAEHGLAAVQTVVSGGQYEFADGLFYGGVRPTWGNVQVRALLLEHASSRQRVGWIDLHSGLGPRGEGEKIYAGHDNVEELARARRWWGATVTSFHEGSSVSAALRGAMYAAVYEECPGVEYTGIALEFGTESLYDVFGALRAEQWLHNHSASVPAPMRAAVKQALLRAFYSDDSAWRERVVNQARAAVNAAVAGLRQT